MNSNINELLLEALYEILKVHCDDNIRPKAFYIASKAIEDYFYKSEEQSENAS